MKSSTNHEMDILAHSDDVLGQNVDFRGRYLELDAIRAAFCHDLIELFGTVEVGHVAGVENVVHVLEH